MADEIIKAQHANGRRGGHGDSNRPVAVVTGAGRGIGRALVNLLREKDYTVIAVVRKLSDVQELFTLDHSRILPVRSDVTEPSTEDVLREFVETQTGRVDLLINNAGYGASNYGIEGLKYEELDRVMQVHLHGPIRCIRACLPYLRQSKDGVIINISSRFGSVEWVANGTVPHDEATYAYRIAKSSLNMLTSCLAVELKKENIRVISVDPGKVKTRFGPQDADTEPETSARAILALAQGCDQTGVFVNAQGEKLPW